MLKLEVIERSVDPKPEVYFPGKERSKFLEYYNKDREFFGTPAFRSILSDSLNNIRDTRVKNRTKATPLIGVRLTHVKTKTSIVSDLILYSNQLKLKEQYVNIKIRLRERIIQKRFEARLTNVEQRHYYHANGGSTIRYQTIGGVFTKPGTILKIQQDRLSKVIFDSKRPLDDTKHVGIELEFLCATAKNDLASQLVNAGLSKYVTLKTDGSLRCDPCLEADDNGEESSGDCICSGGNYEINILAKENEVKQVTKQVLEILSNNYAYVNKTCGMHVHLDMRQRDARGAWDNLMLAQGVMFKMQPKSRQKNTYCKRVTNTEFTLNRNCRYYAINVLALRRFNTLEIRLHSATLELTKIVNWVNLLIGVVDAVDVERTFPRTAKGLGQLFKLPAELTEYIDNRIKKFGNDVTADENAA